MFDKEKIIEKINCGMMLTEEEVEDAISEFGKEDYYDYDVCDRWSIFVTTILKIPTAHEEYKTFALSWSKGLTEYQENYYDSQIAQEVCETEKTVIMKIWETKEGVVMGYDKPF